MMDIEQMSALLKKSIGAKRYKHSVNVMHEAVKLAKRFGVAVEKARVAALLHDCGREIEKKHSALEVKKRGISVLPEDIAQPVLLHAHLGVDIAREKYGVTDEEILRSIALHTTGDRGMTPLDMVVFLADAIEPDRTQVGVEKVRLLAQESLELATLEAIKNAMHYLVSEGLLIHPSSISCWNDLVLRSEQEV